MTNKQTKLEYIFQARQVFKPKHEQNTQFVNNFTRKLETKQKRLKIIRSFSFIFNSKQIEPEAMFGTCEKKKKRIERRKGN